MALVLPHQIDMDGYSIFLVVLQDLQVLLHSRSPKLLHHALKVDDKTSFGVMTCHIEPKSKDITMFKKKKSEE